MNLILTTLNFHLNAQPVAGRKPTLGLNAFPKPGQQDRSVYGRART